MYLSLGLAGFLVIWFVLPRKHEADSLWPFLVKILFFVFLALGVSRFPNKSKYSYLLLLFPFLFYLGYLIPKISYCGFEGIPENIPGIFDELYTYLYLLLYPSIVLSLAGAYRLGGGSSGRCLKIGLVGMVLVFSGLLDIMWFVINPVSVPAVLKNAYHIKVIIGHFPSFNETILFALFHLPLVVGLFLIPFDKFFSKYA